MERRKYRIEDVGYRSREERYKSVYWNAVEYGSISGKGIRSGIGGVLRGGYSKDKDRRILPQEGKYGRNKDIESDND